LGHAGCSLAWLLVQAPLIAHVHGNSGFLDGIYASGAWPQARRLRRAFPVREGEFGALRCILEKASLADVREEGFVAKWAETAWTMAACFSCNSLAGHERPFLPGSWTKLERKLVNAVGLSVKRLLGHGQAEHRDFAALEKELRSKRVNYAGEEVGTCHEITLAQVLPSLPPPEHGGSIDILKFVSESTGYFLRNPQKMVVEDCGQELPKLQGKLHVEKGTELRLANELVSRGVCCWVPFEKVLCFRGQKVLNGLFGVEKSSRLATGKCVLRLIMNLIPSNAVLRTFHGAVSNLPHITAWMSTIILEGEELRVWQSDMQNAFYLFKIPSSWSPMLSFNLVASGQEIGLGGQEQYALGCSVLPMGWSSSVAIMQEASERILALGRLPADEQLLRGRAVPLWMVGLLDEARKKGKAWWHVYLDNFAAGEVGKRGESFSSGHELHQLAESA